MQDILNIIKQMRNSPPKGKDDPRFDELESAVSMYGDEELGEGEDLGMSIEDENAASIEDEAPVDEDEMLMNEAMGAGAEDVALENEEEEEGAAPAFPPKKKKNPLMKKSSYLDA